MSAVLNNPPTPTPRPAASAGHVLVVEDDVVSRNFLQFGLTRQGYFVASAEHVAGAQEELLRKGIESWDCVVTDYRMPNASGLDLLLWIKQQDPSLSTIIVTAQGEKELIAESLRGGAADFLDKPVDLIKLSSAVNRAIEQTRRQRHMAKSESAVQDLSRAQQWMLGVVAPRGPVQVDLCFHPKQDAGGDFFTRFQLSPHKHFCLLTDVSGHDLQAAYVSAYFQGLVRGMLDRATPIEEIFARFNRFLLEEWNHSATLHGKSVSADTSVAACALLIDSKALTATILTHGTPAPVHVTPDGQAHIIGTVGGFPLGWFSEFTPQASVHFIAEGGYFYLWTDGLEDLAEKQGVSPLSLAYCLHQAKERGVAPPGIDSAFDDILVARILLAAARPVTQFFQPLLLETYPGGETALIDEYQAHWQRSLLLALPELPETKLYDVLLASREILLNGLTHGCQGAPNQEVTFQIAIEPTAGLLRVRVSDSGPGHNFNLEHHEAQAADALLEEHRGLILVNHLASHVRLERKGASVVMDFSLAS